MAIRVWLLVIIGGGLVANVASVQVKGADMPALQLVADGFSRPVFLCMPPGDSTRMLVLEKRGMVWLIKNGVRQATPFMDLTSLVYDRGSERGLAGMAFHPSYSTNGYFYLNYNREGDSAQVVSRYHMPDINADICNPNTRVDILVIPQPFDIHKAGYMEFGPLDNYLYISSGDGGGDGDPLNAGQDSTTHRGKILRVDVNRGDTVVAAAGNPFYGRPGWKPEIWALGLRNPWRMSFDRASGNLWISDVGQYEWEEINFQPFNSPGGENYGWRLKEGFHCFSPATGCEELGLDLTDPIIEYSHDTGCAVIGGYVYRGCAMPWLHGTYFYADFCGNGVWSLKYGPNGVRERKTWTTQFGLQGVYLNSFAQDEFGELYILTFSGSIYKIVPESGQSACSGCCVGRAGNVDGVGLVDLTDLATLVAYLTSPAQELPCPARANLDGVGIIDLTDLSSLVAYLTEQVVLRAPCQ